MEKDNNNSKEPEEKGAIVSFMESTSIHGLGSAASAGLSVRGAIWLTLVFFGLGFATYQIYLSIELYLEYNVNTEISLVYDSRLAFPAVTLCNFNKYRRSAMTTDDLALVDFLSIADSYDYEADLSEDLGDDFAPDDLPFDDSTFSLRDYTDRVGFNLTDSMMACFWQGMTCTPDNFTAIYTSLGLCYTFNADLKSVVYQDQPGAGNGLHVTVNIKQDDYTETYKSGNLEVGLKFLIHNQLDPPLMDSQGSAVSPGFHSFVGVKRLNSITLPLPWGGADCENGNPLKRFNDYSLNACFSECRADTIVKQCGCLPIRYPFLENAQEEECALSKMSGCVKDTLKEIKQGERAADCLGACIVPCNYTSYPTTMSYASVPNSNVASDLEAAVGIDGSNSSSDFAENVLLLDVYYEELNYQSFEQSKALTWDGLLGNIGGQLGLFIGCSVLSILEFFEFGVLLLVSFFKSKRPRKTDVQMVNGEKMAMEDYT